MLENGTYTHTFDDRNTPITVTAELALNHELSVYVWVGRATIPSDAAVQIHLSLGQAYIKVDDLYGAVTGSKWHRQGLGALAVNTAIQFIRAVTPHSAALYGHVCDGKDMQFPEAERPKLRENRKAFWRTFGFRVTSPDARNNEFLCGTVGNLKVQTEGKVLGVHPRIFDIQEMQLTS